MKFVARRPTKQQESQLHDTILSPETAGTENDMESWFYRTELIKMKKTSKCKVPSSRYQSLFPINTHSFQKSS